RDSLGVADGKGVRASQQILVGIAVEGYGWTGQTRAQSWHCKQAERAGCREGCRQIIGDLQIVERDVARIGDGDGHRYIECPVAIVDHSTCRLGNSHRRYLREAK